VTPATRTPTPERVRPGSRSGKGDAWKVIVLNDDHNTFQGVAFALAQTIPGVSYERGLELADRIHRSGKAIVWSGHREQAEHYWEQLKDFGLTMAPLGG
jgi:ATP-dependent Clp protease adaptor protein ClpS